jgi:hypothetical protein
MAAVQRDTCRAWCYGEIFSYREDGMTGSCLTRALTDWQAGRLAAERLNGRFVILVWDDVAACWHLITDRFGAQHAYLVMHNNHVLAAASDLATAAGYAPDRTLDWPALAAFLSFGFYLDTDTLYRNIRILPPATITRIDGYGNLLSEKPTFIWTHNPDETRSYDETVEVYDALLGQAVRRRTASGRVLLPLSGGLDSRSLASVMPGGPATEAYSYGYTPDSVETRLAGQVARARGFTFTAHTIAPYLFDRLPELALTLHGSQDLTLARQAAVSRWANTRGDAVLTGLWGDVWCSQMGLHGQPASESGLARQAHQKMLKKGHETLVREVCLPHLAGRDPTQMIYERAADGLASLAGISDPDFRVKIYKTTHWAFRWSNTGLRGFDPGGLARVPYYDIDLADFFCTVPTALLYRRGLQVEHLKRFAPDLARIRWQEAEANLYLARYGRWLSLPRRGLARVRRYVNGRASIERNWEVQLNGPQGEAGLRQWLLEPGLRLHTMISRRSVESLLAAFQARPGPESAYPATMMLSLSAWLETAPPPRL